MKLLLINIPDAKKKKKLAHCVKTKMKNNKIIVIFDICMYLLICLIQVGTRATTSWESYERFKNTCVEHPTGEQVHCYQVTVS